jgi:hypothetical protein
MLAEEHINNFMLSINLNGVTNEDAVVRLFPYTMQGTAGSWYFSLPSGSITSWDIFQNQFLTKFGDDRSTTTLINDLSNPISKLRLENPLKTLTYGSTRSSTKSPLLLNPARK